MSELDWDDPNYIEEPTNYSQSTYNEKYDDNYSRDRRANYGSNNKRDREQREGYCSSKRRESYDRDNGCFSKNAEHAYSESLKISTDMVGRVIGRGGSNITRIQNDFTVRVNVDKVRLLVRVSGSVKVNVNNAIDEIRKQIHSDGGGYSHPAESGGNGYGRSSAGGYARYENGSSTRSNGGGRSSQNSYGGGRSNYDFSSSAADKANDGDLTGTIDWEALNKASVRKLNIESKI